MKKIYRLFILFIISVHTSVAQSYYCVDGLGKLTLYENGKFYFDYFDVVGDTGTYKICGDTLFLTSSKEPIEITKINEDFKKSKGHKCTFWQYDWKNELIKKGEEIYDTIQEGIIYDKKEYMQNDLICFKTINTYCIIWPSDTINSCVLKLDFSVLRTLYFDNYPLLMKDGYLLPIDTYSIDKFFKINRTILIPLKVGDENQEYDVYYSGFGEIH
jgi:hypothetical protein